MMNEGIPIHLKYSRTNSFLLLTYYYFEQVILVYFLVMDDVVASHGELAVIALEQLVHGVENDWVSVCVRVRRMMNFVHLSLVRLSYHDVSSLL